MRKSRKHILYLTFSLIIILFYSFGAFAQDQNDPGCDPLDPTCPIDGGVSLLIAAGIGLGARKAYTQHKKNS